MDEVVSKAIAHFKGEWAVIQHAPFLFFAAVLLVGIGLHFLLRMLFSERHGVQEARINFLSEQLSEYKSKGLASEKRRVILTDAELEDATPDDHYLTIRRTRQSNFKLRLPPNPTVGKEIEVKRAAGDKTFYVAIDGNGAMIDGQKQRGLASPGELRGFRFSGVEWEVF